MNIDITTLIAVGGIAISVATFFIGRVSAGRSSGKQEGQVLSELGYLKSNTDEIKRRLDKQDDRDREYIIRLANVESSVRSAHKRLDDHGVGRAS